MSQSDNDATGQASSQQVDVITPADEQSPDEECWRLCNLLSLGTLFFSGKPKHFHQTKNGSKLGQKST